MTHNKFLFFIFLIFLVILSFNVSAVDINSCQTLNAGTSYKLTANVSSAGTCFTFNGNNIELDCDGYWIDYDMSASGSAIVINARQNPVVKNCNIRQMTSQTSGYGLYIYGGSSNAYVNNTYVYTRGSSAYGIYLSNAPGTRIEESNIETAIANTVSGIYILSTTNATIRNTNITAIREQCLWVYSTIGLQHDHTIQNVNCEGKPILYMYNNNTKFSDWDASEYGQVLLTASDGWECNNCTFTESGVFFSGVINSVINNSVVNATDSSGLNFFGLNSNNKVENTIIHVNGPQTNGRAIYLSTSSNSNEFNNLSIVVNSPTSYAFWLNAVTGNNFNNISISMLQATAYGVRFANSDNNYFNGFNFTSSVTSNVIYLTGTANTGNEFRNFNSVQTGTSSSNRFLDSTGTNAINFYDGSISVSATSGRAFYYRATGHGITSTYDVTFDNDKVQFLSGSNAELRKHWSFNAYVDEILGVIQGASVKLYNSLLGLEYNKVSGADGKTEKGYVTQYRRTEAGTTSYNTYRIIASKADYLSRYISIDIEEPKVDYTITLVKYVRNYPLPYFELPTPEHLQIIPRDYFTVNVSVRDYAYEIFTWDDAPGGYNHIHSWSHSGGEPVQQVFRTIDKNNAVKWTPNPLVKPAWVVYDLYDAYTVGHLNIYTNPSANGQVCAVTINIADDPVNGPWVVVGTFTLAGAFPNWYRVSLLNEFSSRYIRVTYHAWDFVGGTCSNNNAFSDGIYEINFETLTAPGEVDGCELFITDKNGQTSVPMDMDVITPDFVYCSYDLDTLDEDTYSFYVIAEDDEANEGRSETRAVQVKLTGPTINFVGQTPNNLETIVGRDWVTIEVKGMENLYNTFIQWEKVGETEDNFTMYGSGEDWYINMTYLSTGQYRFRVYAQDNQDLWGWTEERTFWLNVEGIPPTITFIYPTPKDRVALTINTFIIKVDSSEDLSFATIVFDDVEFVMDGADTSWNLTLSDITEGIYYYHVYGDSMTSGLSARTETRMIIIGDPLRIQLKETIFLLLFCVIALVLFVLGINRKDPVFMFFCAFILIGLSIFVWTTPLVYINPILNEIFAWVLTGLGVYVLLKTSIEVTGGL